MMRILLCVIVSAWILETASQANFNLMRSVSGRSLDVEALDSTVTAHNENNNHGSLPTQAMFTISHRSDLHLGGRASKDRPHKIVFARKQSNLDTLRQQLLKVSDPKSPLYGRHISRSEIADMTASPDGLAAIHSFLATHDIPIKKTTLYLDYIIAEAPIHVWEEVFNTKFYEISHKIREGVSVARCLNFTIPVELVGHVDAIFNTDQLPDHHIGKRLHFERGTAGVHQESTRFQSQTFGVVDPPLLNSFYNIQSNTGNDLTNQAVYAILDQTMSPTDLATFQSTYGIPNQPIASNVGGHVANNACSNDVSDCIEANLDVQYIMAVAQDVPTIYYYWQGDDVWLDWITTVADMEDPPDIFTISYGSYEAAFSADYLTAFDVEAMKLGLAGTSILAASGDDGVVGFLARDNTVSCGYYASFPASSPYVTAVGGTMGPEYGDDEVACQSDLGSSITSGGGFSHVHTLPAWQASEVTAYFARVEGTSKQPAAGFDNNKRGYPDVSILANLYVVIADGGAVIVSGTSASCPVMAGMVSLVNSARRAAGNSTLGWLNPALYALRHKFVNDITSGDNRCLASGYGCCEEGFFAANGWDPVTGLGSVDFNRFKAAMLGIDPQAIEQFSNTEKNRWIVWNGYDQEDCPSEEDVMEQSGVPTGVCLTEYDGNGTAVSSSRYSCSPDLDLAYRFKFNSPDCNETLALGHDTYELSCSNNPGDGSSTAASTRATCVESDGLPLLTGTFVVERFFDSLSSCPSSATSKYNAWRTGHCFASDQQSFAVSTNLTLSRYNGTTCTDSKRVSATTLSTTCSPVPDPPEGTSDVRVQYSLSDISDKNDQFSFLGLNYTTLAGIGIAIVCLLFLVITYLCRCMCGCGGGSSSNRVTHIPTREPVTCTVAQVEGPQYQEVPVVVAFVHNERGVQMV